jgi:UDP-galactopyranose mutase
MVWDYVVVGCGMYGSAFARRVAERGRRVLVLERRTHIGGNCFTYNDHGVEVHAYGPHIFHTSSERIWDFVNRFAPFNDYRHRVAVNFRGRLFSFPVNLLTLAQLWGVATPAEAEVRLAAARVPIAAPANLEEWALAHVGREVYETFIRGYTAKQWGRDPRALPASILRRIPIRTTYDDRYFDDTYQGIPREGYTALFHAMLDHPGIRVETGVDFFSDRRRLAGLGRTLVYTGPIDEYFECRLGRLDYRSLRFEHELREGDFQGTAIVNYTAEEVPFTRIAEHKHFANPANRWTVVSREFPQPYDAGRVPYYPVRDEKNTALYERYRDLADATGAIFGGRLGTYCYYDMHQVLAQALAEADRSLEREPAVRRAA